MKLLAFLLSRSRGLLVLATFAGIVSGASSSALVSVINNALTQDTFRSGKTLATFGGILVLFVTSRLASQYVLNHLNQGALLELRMRLSRRVLTSTLRQLEETGMHRLQTLLTDDIPAVSNSLSLLPTIAISAATLIGCLAYLATLSPIIFVFMIGFIIVGGLIYRLPVRLSLKYFQQSRAQSDILNKAFRSLMEGIKELKLHAPRRTAFLSQGVEVPAKELRRLMRVSSNILSTNASWTSFLFFAFLGLLLFSVTRLTDVSATTLTSCTLIILYLQQPLDLLLGSLNVLGRGNIALERLQQLDPQGWNAKENDSPSYEGTPPRFERLELRGVTHTYFRENDDTRFVLGPINLTFQRGELVFLVGGNGSGKTTFGKLLTGLYAPDAGEVWLNGERVTDANREQYRQQFTAVFSDFHLFDNLFGLDPSDRGARVREYLSRLQLDHKVRISEEGTLSTTSLSQGQRKRLALLTAYLEERSFYLFDEWAADQDPAFKEIFYNQLLPDLKAQGKTVLVISHDNRFFQVADRLLVLESGRLVDSSPAIGLELPERHRNAS
ncbi:ABC transporter ATP-binding protein [Myxococcus stipitatus DSM 14675]|uniref:ABC transporter ATP-binding protein n=1 Tax=Myxococcus stipitatus (strain DSM 14675 / JCM 12634 / Mx s8) TaxID=1278073 RepID=L7UDG1_MYXSD|nr:cyclic peptide export ABC transporter [Myxococcus stipitatus]AGC45647.1 ABC transporter ATP-binding protein [Myxococcus stipitatus DSM 14675]